MTRSRTAQQRMTRRSASLTKCVRNESHLSSRTFDRARTLRRPSEPTTPPPAVRFRPGAAAMAIEVSTRSFETYRACCRGTADPMSLPLPNPDSAGPTSCDGRTRGVAPDSSGCRQENSVRQRFETGRLVPFRDQLRCGPGETRHQILWGRPARDRTESNGAWAWARAPSRWHDLGTRWW